MMSLQSLREKVSGLRHIGHVRGLNELEMSQLREYMQRVDVVGENCLSDQERGEFHRLFLRYNMTISKICGLPHS